MLWLCCDRVVDGQLSCERDCDCVVDVLMSYSCVMDVLLMSCTNVVLVLSVECLLPR